MDEKLSYNIYIKHPSKCRKDELDNFCALVIEGGQVSSRGVQMRIRQAQYLGFAYFRNELVGISALKIPGNSYRQSVFRNAHSLKLAQEYAFELGWCYTKARHRRKGVCRYCISELLRAEPDQNIFATTLSDKMQNILKDFGFILSGQPYGSNLCVGRLLYLYVLNRKT